MTDVHDRPPSRPATGTGQAGTMLDLLPDPVLTLDGHGTVLDVNAAGRRAFGPVTGSPLAGMVHPADRPALLRALSAMARGVAVPTLPLRCCDARGGWTRWDGGGRGDPTAGVICLSLRGLPGAAGPGPATARASAPGPASDGPAAPAADSSATMLPDSAPGPAADTGPELATRTWPANGRDPGARAAGKGAPGTEAAPGAHKPGDAQPGMTGHAGAAGPETAVQRAPGPGNGHARLRLLLDQAPVAVALCDLATGRLQEVSPGFLALAGLGPSPPLPDLATLARRGGWGPVLRRAQARLRRRDRFGPVELDGPRPEGGSQAGSNRLRVRAMREPASDAAWMFVEDISEIHACREECALVGQVLRSTNALVTLTDTLGRVTWVNGAFERVTGWPLAMLRGRTPGSRLQGPRTDPATVARIRAALRARTPIREEILNQRRDGRPIWLDLDIQPRRAPDGRVVGFMAIQTDITERKRLEHALRAERNSLMATLNALPDMLIEVDADGRYERILCRDLDAMPQPPEAYPGRFLEEMLPPDLARMTRAAMARVHAGEEVRGMRYLREVRGRAIWCETSMTRRPPAEAGGRPGYVFLTRDVTERTRAEAEHANLAQVAALTTNLVIILDTEERVEWANPAFTAQTGWTLEEARGRPLGELVRDPDSDPGTIARLEAALAAGVAFRGEILNRSRDGRRYWVDFDVHPRRGPDGELRGYITVETVISGRKALQAALQAERDYLRGLMETLISGIVALDSEGRIVFANREAETMLGLSRSMLSGRRFDDPAWRIEAVDGGPLPAAALPFAQVMATGRSVRDLRHAITWPDGTRRVLSINAAPVHLPEHGARVVCAVTDITDHLAAEDALREAAQAAQAASLAKSAFLTNMSHEIRTPLNGILGMAELLAERLPAGEAREMVQTIRDSGETLLALLNDLLDMSRIEAGKLQMDVAPFCPVTLLRRLDAMYRPIARSRGLDWRLEIAAPAAAPRLGDSHRLLQMLHNLLGNALKFTEAGGISLRLSLTPEGGLCFEVADTGCGMCPETLIRVQQEFEQADASITRRHGGSGLGLAIVTRLAQLMGGRLRLDSSVGAGTRARLILPLEVAPRADEPQRLPDTAAGTAALAGRRLLVADDNATNRRILQAFLEGDGAEVALAEDGLAALAQWRSGRFDAILLDISMPRLDGESALAAMQAEALARRIAVPPALAITAHAMPEQVARYLAAGFSAHLAKPLRRAEVRAALCALLAPPGT